MRILVAASVLAALALGLRTGPARADGAVAAPCSAPEYHQLDFWVGDWDVYEPGGKLQGHNKVEKVYDGCVLQEHWVGTEGDTGSSFNIYDASRQVWNETWVSNRGYLLSFDGRLHGKDMVLIGSHLDAHGLPELHRGVWTPTDYGVHQTWEVSTDGGRTWTMRFEGILRRSGQSAAR